MLYPIRTNSKPAVGKEGKKIILAVLSDEPICNNSASATISTIVARRGLTRALRK